MQKFFRSAVVGLALASLFSCMLSSPPRSVPDSPALEKKLAETNQRLDELYQRVSALQLMVDPQQREKQDLKSPGTHSSSGESITEENISATPSTSIAPPSAPPPPAVETSVTTPTLEPFATASAINGVQVQQAEPTPSSADVEDLYKKAYGQFQKREYESAIGLFDTLAARYPNHGLADNALYWAGESRFALRDYRGAVLSFNAVLKRYPNGNKAADALYKAGLSYLAAGEKENGIDYLKKTITQYPFSTTAPKAEAKLKQIQ